MNKFIITVTLFSLLVLSSIPVNACDICGCGVSSGPFTGILPQFSRNVIGMRMSSQKYTHPNTELNMNGTSRVLEDQYHTAELWLRYYPAPRWQTFVFLPYKFNQRIESERTSNLSGIGDLYVTAYYTMVNTADSVKKRIKVNWLLGGGLKLPTGKYQQRDINKTMLPIGFQAGTGAYSLLLSSNLSVRRQAFGLNSQVNYTINGTNELDYRIGNGFSGTLSAFYWKNYKNIKLLPNVGVIAEKTSKDAQYGLLKETSGSRSLIASTGLEIYTGQWLISFNYQRSIYQELQAAQPSNVYKVMLGCGRFF
jgi:hypothetical protein